MEHVRLVPVTRRNWRICVDLTVAEHQRAFLRCNSYALAQAAYEPGMLPYLAYAGPLAVGFVMLWNAVAGGYYIAPLMVDHRQQRRGYGRAILRSALDLLRQRPDCRVIYITFTQGNVVAERLYRSEGFRPTGQIQDGEIYMQFDLGR